MKRIIFITGGARSGKSSFALKSATELPGRKVYIATARPVDDEMKERIKRHKGQRSSEWQTVEEPLRISELIKELKWQYPVMLLDCLTLWLSNLMVDSHNPVTVNKEIEYFIDALKDFKKDPGKPEEGYLFIVSNEVGMGIVPANELARWFRDEAGRLNQMIAEIADDVYFVISGIPLRLKGVEDKS